MTAFFPFLAEHPEVLLFAIIALGSLIGLITIRGVALGSAAVLFVAIAVSAWSHSEGVTLELPGFVANLGLALFCFAVGLQAGPTFFSTMRRSMGTVAVSFAMIVLGGVVAFAMAGPFGLTLDQAAGTFAGAVTNTPALAAAGASAEATVGYSVAYVFGVLGMILVTNVALRRRHEDKDVPVSLLTEDVRVERSDRPTVAEVLERYGHRITFTRIKREGEQLHVPRLDEEMLPGDVLTIDGHEPLVRLAIEWLGHESSQNIVYDRRELDFRRMTMSDPSLSGRTVAELGLADRFQATITRVRRGDVDMIAEEDTVLQWGDRVRVVAPRKYMPEITKLLGDSSRGHTSLNPVAIGVGMALGFAIGAIPLPSPGGGTIALGGALGSLVVGILMGRVGRIGLFVTVLPFTVTTVLADFGLLLFLAQAGVKSGVVIIGAFTSGAWLGIVGLGALVTLFVGFSTLFLQRRLFGMGGTRLSGVLAGTQSHPALLAYAQGRTGYDFRVSEGYTTVYAVSFLTKIVVGSLFAIFL